LAIDGENMANFTLARKKALAKTQRRNLRHRQKPFMLQAGENEKWHLRL
jgi:hypothetical protein